MNQRSETASHGLLSTYKGASIDSDGDLRCKCGFDMRVSQVKNIKNPVSWEGLESASRCRIFIWYDELPQIKHLLPRFSEPVTPKKTIDIRRFGVVTPTSTSKKNYQETDKNISPSKESNTSVSAQARKRLFSNPEQSHKKLKVLRTPPRSPSPTDSEILDDLTDDPADNSASSTSGGTQRSKRRKEYQKSVLESPTKARAQKGEWKRNNKTEAKEEDLLSDWSDTTTSEAIRITERLE
ncbi:hypothetical protein ASPWEDRAFT_177536 [Aspergillus wentii DTO 134E9]|uniref:Uncharacterized protein n=1 Tax=Aspergillus wentii DTO 134E9 TaxID=1073089 RepID=A0A1L9R4I4_ASPWE|nr:uncharacterized protein ASPWEDRAFT_177536 [Aspergillus wentii DTO 134E9]KAI9927076.1 hypothetical protein MW887_003459 [Aspergillus wentii]OJJ29797.1 hypothetical protein ASPWEDRAFT_177536 [Aspergillus wentii DTO 134E9]